MTTSRGARSLKRALDAALAVILAVALAPLMGIVAVCVWATLGRPLVFLQRRPGLHRRIFTIRKFRTMSDGRDAAGQWLPDEARTPWMGWWLRRLRLDELPEVWNLLVGDMSLVGPRPLLPSSLDTLTTYEARRHEVRPGITGWAQVNGNTRLSLQEKALLDVWYVDHWSLWLDIRIVVRTVVVVMTGERIHPDALQEAERHADRVGGRGGQHARGAGGTG